MLFLLQLMGIERLPNNSNYTTPLAVSAAVKPERMAVVTNFITLVVDAHIVVSQWSSDRRS
ncbi:MAG: hypothetical protein MSG64_05365 [Pyrinomonadaceae bacterium MAG19_C2-C3]|nr:hypothetical protein [Pyrinomonadaceae bacterium MAG19_C2-C3]